MNSTVHPVAPEEIMNLLDGELSAEERQAVTTHLAQCAECAAIRDQFLDTSRALAQWTVPQAPPSLDRAMEAKLANKPSSPGDRSPRTLAPLGSRRRLWAVGSGGALAGALLVVAIAAIAVSWPRPHSQYEPVEETRTTGAAAPELAQPALSPMQAGISEADNRNMAALAPMPQGVVGGSVAAPAPPPPVAAPAAPMIARTVSLTIRVKDIAASRAVLDTILAQHNGYAASLTLNTPDDGPRSFQSSLRIPAPELQAALDALRKLGRVENETQAGEEVTQQHADLVAHLTNARETEQRLRQLLTERTGKMEDVLDVEEKISETRGEIESMEAEQNLLEHRVAFATVDLQLVEEYKEQLATSTTVSAGTLLHNAFIAGARHAGGTILGLILFLEEYGPVLLIWLVILGVPAVFVWRRYRRVRGKY